MYQQALWPFWAFLFGAAFLSGLFLGIVSLVGGFDHARSLFWDERWVTFPMVTGFGIQAALYTILKKRLFAPVAQMGPSGVLTGAGGGTSTVAMVACCAHHIADLLPVLGLTAAATFLANYRNLFIAVGLGTTSLGIAVMLYILIRERKRAAEFSAGYLEAL